MNIERIRLAMRKFLGVHDFRNFCKKDADLGGGQPDEDGAEEANFMRRMYHLELHSVHVNNTNDRLSIWMI